ncbi:MAG TPA: LLM class flavin-dependent oxidoreductase [Candidatus Dormibacteraeota bacterium]|nr:LLM class flavin-dependent oxidoreductase [Candidatus Dormibacteraeota bacterium]
MGREIGLVIITGQVGPDRETARWVEIRELALRAEALGFDTVWAPDELLWRPEGRPPLGVWEGVAMLGGLAAVTTRIKVGSWVMSALHRNPGITAKVAETLDEISGGRFLFGLGAGHAWPGQAHAFGLPEDHIYARFEEALEIIVPLLRAGRAEFQGTWHAANDLEQRPLGPRPGRIPIMLAGHGERGMRHAARLADIWSCYAEQRSDVAELGPRIAALEAACAEVGRDPATIGRSAGIDVAPAARPGSPGISAGAVGGSSEEIADSLRRLYEVGFTQLECTLYPQSRASLEAMAPVLESLVSA